MSRRVPLARDVTFDTMQRTRGIYIVCRVIIVLIKALHGRQIELKRVSWKEISNVFKNHIP